MKVYRVYKESDGSTVAVFQDASEAKEFASRDYERFGDSKGEFKYALEEVELRNPVVYIITDDDCELVPTPVMAFSSMSLAESYLERLKKSHGPDGRNRFDIQVMDVDPL